MPVLAKPNCRKYSNRPRRSNRPAKMNRENSTKNKTRSKLSAPNAATNLRLEWASYEAAKYAVEHWHYSKSLPSSKLAKVGVWEDDKFIGVVIFSWGAQKYLVRRYGLNMTQGCELTRVALNKHKTPVTRIVKIAVKKLKDYCPELRLIVSFADANQNHLGKIYQAGNWIYTGMSEAVKYPVLNGRVTHPRTLSKEFLNKLKRKGIIQKRQDLKFVAQKGKFRYLLPLDDEMRERIEPLRRPYPKNL